jgi:hypothetical protein
MSSLPPDVTKMLHAERARPGPTPEESARLVDRLETAIALLPPGGVGGPGGGSGAPAAPHTNPPAPSPADGAAWIARAHPYAVSAISLATGAILGVAVDRAVLSTPRQEVVYVDRVVLAPAADSGAPPASVSTEGSGPAVAASTPPASSGPGAIAVSPPSAAASTGKDRDLAGERRLLQTARTALGRGDPESALATLERHAREYQGGQLGQEREALTIQALVGLGRRSEARTRAERFRARFPNSLLIPVIDQAVPVDP